LTKEFVVDTLAYQLNRQVLSFATEEEARDYIGQGDSAQLFIVGVDGTDLDGFDLIGTIKQSSPAKICIAMSATVDHEQQAAGMSADGFLAKPFGMADLFELAEHFLVERDSPAEVEAEN